MKKWLFIILILSAYLSALAQLAPMRTKDDSTFQRKKSNRERNYFFLQQTLNYSALSYVSPPFHDVGSPKDWYWLSADVIPQFTIGGDWMPFPIHLTPRYKVRIMHDNRVKGDSSLPVRTPSFMPGATIHFPLYGVHEDSRQLRYLSLSVFHHSNGQDGNEFNSNGTINTYNGNFSTNYVEPAFHFRNRWYSGDSSEGLDSLDFWDFYGRAGYEAHFGTAQALKPTYGGARINLTLGWIRVLRHIDKIIGRTTGVPYYREYHRIVLTSTFIAGSRTGSGAELRHRVNFDLKFYRRLPSSPNTSIFIGGGYFGSDTYNIYYLNNYWFASAGIAMGFFVSPDKTRLKKKGYK